MKGSKEEVSKIIYVPGTGRKVVSLKRIRKLEGKLSWEG